MLCRKVVYGWCIFPDQLMNTDPIVNYFFAAVSLHEFGRAPWDVNASNSSQIYLPESHEDHLWNFCTYTCCVIIPRFYWSIPNHICGKPMDY
jgi:hypothetical protein